MTLMIKADTAENKCKTKDKNQWSTSWTSIKWDQKGSLTKIKVEEDLKKYKIKSIDSST